MEVTVMWMGTKLNDGQEKADSWVEPHTRKWEKAKLCLNVDHHSRYF